MKGGCTAEDAVQHPVDTVDFGAAAGLALDFREAAAMAEEVGVTATVGVVQHQADRREAGEWGGGGGRLEVVWALLLEAREAEEAVAVKARRRRRGWYWDGGGGGGGGGFGFNPVATGWATGGGGVGGVWGGLGAHQRPRRLGRRRR